MGRGWGGGGGREGKGFGGGGKEEVNGRGKRGGERGGEEGHEKQSAPFPNRPTLSSGKAICERLDPNC